MLIPTRYKKAAWFVIAIFTLSGLSFHCIASKTIEASAAIILNIIITVLPASLFLYIAFPKTRSIMLNAFYLFFSIYFLFSSFARLNAEIFNPESETYQNESDASTIFELSVDWDSVSKEESRLITDTGGALTVFHLFYQVAAILNLTATPSIGITLNAVLVALGSTVGVFGAIRLFGKTPKPVRLVTFWFATSGLAFLYSGLHLRDSFLYLLNAVLFVLIIDVDCKKIDSRIALNLLLAGSLVWIMTVFRDESMFILYGYILTLVLEFAFHVDKRLRPFILISFIILMVVSVRLLSDQYADLIDATNLVYRENQGSGAGLATKYVVNAPNWIRPFIGIPYMVLGHIPFFSGFLLDEWYYWFVSIQAVQGIVVLPSFLYCIFKWSVSKKFECFDPFRKIYIFYVIMGAVISLSTLSYRHFGQFLPYLYVIAAKGCSESSSVYRWVSGFIIVVPISVLWYIVKT